MADLYREYILLAMRADKRLQRLEKYSQRESWEWLTKGGAYQRAMRDIRVWRGEGHKRFLAKLPKGLDVRSEAGERYLKAIINDINSFLRSDTSTLKPGKGTNGAAAGRYQKAADTFNNKYGTDLTSRELANFFESTKFDKAFKNAGSETVMQAVVNLHKMYKKNPKVSRAKLLEEIKNNPNMKLDDDKVIDEVMKKLLAQGISPRTIFSPSKQVKKKKKKDPVEKFRKNIKKAVKPKRKSKKKNQKKDNK